MNSYPTLAEAHSLGLDVGVTVYPHTRDVRSSAAEDVPLVSLRDVDAWMREAKVERWDKKDVPLFTRGFCEGNRRKGGCQGPLMLWVDFDDVTMPPMEAHHRLSMLGVSHIIDTTWSHGKTDLYRYRVVLDVVALTWAEVPSVVKQLEALLGIPVDPYSFTGQAFYVPAVQIATKRADLYRHYAFFDGDWRPSWEEPTEADQGHADLNSATPRETPYDRDEVLDMLTKTVPNIERDDWVRVGMALEACGEEWGREVWDEWSQQGDGGYKFNPDDSDFHFNVDFPRTRAPKDPGRLLRLESFFKEAYAAGWKSPKKGVREGPLTGTKAAEAWAKEIEERDAALEAGEVHEVDLTLGERYAELDKRFAYLTAGQGKVIDTQASPLRLISTSAFRDRYAMPRPIVEWGGASGNTPIYKSMGEAWMRYYSRRPSYDRLDFMPGDLAGSCPAAVYNMWRGWPDLGHPTTCELQLKHLREVICTGREDIYDWIIKWGAHMLQRPWEKPGTAIVLRGEEGIGKGIFVEPLRMIVGEAYVLQLVQTRQLVGNFNAHMAGKLLIYGDEATWGGAKQDEGPLKALITEHAMMIERKGLDVESERSCHRLILASNGEWMVPAGKGARRFQMMDVSDRFKEDKAYFGPLVAEINNGGAAALRDHLLAIDLSQGPDIRKIIGTAALADQKIRTLDDIDRWVFEVLRAGQFSTGAPWPGPDMEPVPTAAVYEDYQRSARGNYSGRAASMIVSNRLKKILGRSATFGQQGVDKVRTGADRRGRAFRFPSLEEARVAFERYLGAEGDLDWSG